MSKLHIGVIGAGGRGNLADNAHKPAEGVHLIAGADINPEDLEKLQKRTYVI